MVAARPQARGGPGAPETVGAPPARFGCASPAGPYAATSSRPRGREARLQRRWHRGDDLRGPAVRAQAPSQTAAISRRAEQIGNENRNTEQVGGRGLDITSTRTGLLGRARG